MNVLFFVVSLVSLVELRTKVSPIQFNYNVMSVTNVTYQCKVVSSCCESGHVCTLLCIAFYIQYHPALKLFMYFVYKSMSHIITIISIICSSVFFQKKINK